MEQKTKKTEKSDLPFDYKTIKTFKDACKKLNLDTAKLPDVSIMPERFRKPIIAASKLMIIYEAINNGWIPDWGNSNQWKYYPWYDFLSSGFGFSFTFYFYDRTSTIVGSRLCTDTREKALYIAEQFKTEYQEYFLFQNK